MKLSKTWVKGLIVAVGQAAVSLNPSAAWSETAAPFQRERSFIDRLQQDAAHEGMEGQSVRRLKSIIETRGQPFVRAYSMHSLARLPDPSVENYLVALAGRDDLADELREAALVATWRHRYWRESDPLRRAAVLANAMSVTFRGEPSDDVRIWAARELCNAGFQRLMEPAQAWFRFRDPSPRGENNAVLCRMQVDILSEYPARVDGLAAALSRPDPFLDRAFHEWAVEELLRLETPGADLRLADYAAVAGRSSDPAGAALQRRVIRGLEQDHGWTPERLAAHGLPVRR